MLELEQIKKTDPIKMLRGQLNTAFNEIQRNQPLVGMCMNPSVNIYDEHHRLVQAVTASNVSNYLRALILPGNNGAYVYSVKGSIDFSINVSETTHDMFEICVDVPAIKAAGKTYSTFVPPSHLGLPHVDPNPSEFTTDEAEYMLGMVIFYSADQSEFKHPTFYAVTNANKPNMFEIRAYGAVTVPIEVGNQAISLTF